MQQPHTDTLANYFQTFRNEIVGDTTTFKSPFGEKRILYADWIASGRLYAPIENRLRFEFGKYVANTHTETNTTGSLMTHAYHEAKHIIKEHVNANNADVLLMVGSGMTAAINKFQRILGLRVPEQYQKTVKIARENRPVIFVTHMEHHSNQTTWLETIGEVVVVAPCPQGLVCLDSFANAIAKYSDRPMKIAAITACSNITGIETPYHTVAEMMHRAGGLCFVDFACSAPYVNIDMHPADRPDAHLDAIYFSPHKFLGGPGTPGVLIFDSVLYKLETPDQPGGGTVEWTNPWGGHEYIKDIESREDGGTPPFLQTIQTALCIRLKEKMGVENILAREHELLAYLLPRFETIKGMKVLAANVRERLGVVSFYVEGLHYNLAVRLLNDRFGIQVRGGCSCAGTYGHYLLEVSVEQSMAITDKISHGDLSDKPGWIRLSVHPTMTDAEAVFVADAIAALAQNYQLWALDYNYNRKTNEFDTKYKADFCEATTAKQLLVL
jgi:selenocysteine lyase/cysteine desulfurase